MNENFQKAYQFRDSIIWQKQALRCRVLKSLVLKPGEDPNFVLDRMEQEGSFVLVVDSELGIRKHCFLCGKDLNLFIAGGKAKPEHSCKKGQIIVDAAALKFLNKLVANCNQLIGIMEKQVGVKNC